MVPPSRSVSQLSGISFIPFISSSSSSSDTVIVIGSLIFKLVIGNSDPIGFHPASLILPSNCTLPSTILTSAVLRSPTVTVSLSVSIFQYPGTAILLPFSLTAGTIPSIVPTPDPGAVSSIVIILSGGSTCSIGSLALFEASVILTLIYTSSPSL